MNARTRKSLTLLWTALFLFSLALQSVQMVAPQAALAVHNDGLFELDGNALNGSAAGDDWQAVYGNSDSAFDSRFDPDPVDSTDTAFTGGSTKDDLNIGSWLWKTGEVPQAKNDISDAFAAAYTHPTTNDTIAYFGLDKLEADGTNFVGFWFLKQDVAPTGSGNPPGSPFAGTHSVGDILVLASYTNGGAVATFDVYKWVGSGGNVNSTLQTVANGVPCTTGGLEDFACGATNATTIDSPWPYDGRDGAPGVFPPATFFEGGINLTDLGLDTECFSTFIAETRSSASVDATLSDFAIGQFSLCVPPIISTQVKNDQGQGTGMVTINAGESVTDTAVVGGPRGAGEGIVDFFVCGPTNSAQACNTGGTPVGSNIDLAGGEAKSSIFKPSAKPTAGQPDYYCFRVEFTPADDSKYLAGAHTNNTTECVRVIPADVRVIKGPDNGTANAGDSISFNLFWGNVGEGKATGVVVTDTLPDEPGLNWSITDSTGTGSECDIAGPVGAQILTCTIGAINGNTPAGASGLTDNTKNSGSVTLTSGTTPATCGVIDNRGRITSDNDGTNTDDGQITVQCPNVKVVKTPNNGQVNAGDATFFDIVVSNAGPGTASGVTLTDPLPTGLVWSLGAISGDTTGVSCSVSPLPAPPAPQQLSCSDSSMTSGQSFTVRVTTTTSSSQCATYPNLATVDATNEPNTEAYTADNTDPGSITVNCPDVQALKTADASPVNAGDQIGFTVTIKNNGAGTAYGATGSDTLPTGIAWAIDGAANGWSISAGGVLSFGPADLIAGASAAVHIVGTTDAADCRLIRNTVTVDATNESNDASIIDDNLAFADVTVNCPDVQALKTADASPVNAGDQVGFTITIKNNGLGTAKGATGSDTLPTGIAWTIDGAANGWSISPAGVLTFGPANLAAGASAAVHIIGTTDAADCRLIPNTVTVDATNESNDASVIDDNTASASITVNCPNLVVNKTAEDGTISAGEVAEFSIDITNIGLGLAKHVSLTDTLPAGVVWHVDSVAFGGVAVLDPSVLCTISGATLVCPNLGDLASGGTITIAVSGDTDLDDCGSLVNTVVVDAVNESNDVQFTIDNTDSATVVVDCPLLAIDKDADHVAPVVIGGQIGFTVTIRNNGEGTAFGVTVSDTLDSDFAWSISPASAGWSLVGNVLSFSGNLAADASSAVHVIAPSTVGNTAQCGAVPNTAVLDHSSIDPTPASASETVQCPDVEIVKGANDDLVEPNQTVTFLLDVEVVDGPVTNGVVTDVLPVGQTYVAGSATSKVRPAVAFTADEPTVSANGRTLTWDFATLGTGDPSVTIMYDVKIDANATTAVQVNEAKICVSELPTCDTDTEDVTPQRPAIVLIKTAGTAANGTVLATTAGPVTYTYVVTNSGPLPLVNVTVTDDAGTPAVTTDDFAATCPKTTLAVAESMTCTFTKTIRVDTVNVAVARGVTAGGNPVQDDDDARVVILEFGLLLDKTNNAPLVPLELPDGTIVNVPTADEGDTVTYTLAYTLVGDPVTNGVLTDVLPLGVTYVAGSATNNAQFIFQSYTAATRTLRWTAATVSANGSVTYQAKVDIGAAEFVQPLLNVATIDSAETQPDVDDSEIFVPTIVAGATATPRITLPPTDTFATDSPAPSNGGYTLMLVLLALAAVVLVIGFVTPVPVSVRERTRR